MEPPNSTDIVNNVAQRVTAIRNLQKKTEISVTNLIFFQLESVNIEGKKTRKKNLFELLRSEINRVTNFRINALR